MQIGSWHSCLMSALSVVVITFALHAKGGQFDPGSAHIFYIDKIECN